MGYGGFGSSISVLLVRGDFAQEAAKENSHGAGLAGRGHGRPASPGPPCNQSLGKTNFIFHVSLSVLLRTRSRFFSTGLCNILVVRIQEQM